MPASKPAMLSDVMPNSSAWIVAKIAHSTACAHRESPSIDGGRQRFLGEHLGQDRQRLGAGRVRRAEARQLARIARPPVALPCLERRLDRRRVGERPDLPRQAEARRFGRCVAFRRRALRDADDHVVHVGDGREPAVGGDHHPLTVVEVRLEERRRLAAVTGGCPRGVAHEDVDLAGLQRGEAVGGGEVDELDLGRVAEHGGGDDPAEVDIEADVLTRRVDGAEPRDGVVAAAADDVVGDDRVEDRLARLHLLGAVGSRALGVTGRRVGSRVVGCDRVVRRALRCFRRTRQRRLGGTVVVVGCARAERPARRRRLGQGNGKTNGA